MTTPEGKVKAKVKQLLKQYGAYQHWPVLNGMGAPTLDCICCYKGRFIAVETKAEGKKPTPRQLLTMADMRASNAAVFIVSCDAELDDLETYLKSIGD